MSNQSQYERILASRSLKICVIAGPGSGKTKEVLIPKTQQLLASGEIDPRQILLLSFSRLSAADLRDRCASAGLLPKASTVHSFCLSLLLSGNAQGIRDRVQSIIFDFEKEPLAHDLKVRFPRLGIRDIKKKLKEYSAGWSVKPQEEIFEDNEDNRRFKFAVTNWLTEHRAAFMEEIVANAVKLAETMHGLSATNDIAYILVDEYQDLNRIEQKFIGILAQNSKLLLVVGDPDQSIYSFKFAYHTGIRTFASSAGVEPHSLEYCGRCSKKIISVANQLLLQIDPSRQQLLKHLPTAEDGEIHFAMRNDQSAEFDYVLQSIVNRLDSGASPSDVLVLVPRKDLGNSFIEHARTSGVAQSVNFALVCKKEFSSAEKQAILQLSIVADPQAVVHIRALLGLNDESQFAAEFEEVKLKYGSLAEALKRASESDFPPRRARVVRLCQKISELNEFVARHAEMELQEVIDELFPENNSELGELRRIIFSLVEEGDDAKSLCGKLVDQLRTAPEDENSVRVMTIQASKGLDADHVYIIGCNDGNIPGSGNSEVLSPYEHEQEQKRLLYVGFTRAKKTLTVSLSRQISFHQSCSQNTASIGTRRRQSVPLAQVAPSRFLQNIEGIVWE